VSQGQEAGEFGPIDPADFAVTMSALMDGFAVQIALEDPTVGTGRAFEVCMRFVASQLGFTWVPRHRTGDNGPAAGAQPANAPAASRA
jgi:hypothetical protein